MPHTMAVILTKFCHYHWKISLSITKEILSAKKLTPLGKKQDKSKDLIQYCFWFVLLFYFRERIGCRRVSWGGEVAIFHSTDRS